MSELAFISLSAALAGKLLILWLLGIPAGILIIIFIVVKLFT